MNNKLGKKAATTLAVGALLTASGCSSLQGYTINGVPAEKLYAASGQSATDATVDNSEANFCSTNPATCVVGAAVAVGVVTWAVVQANKKTSSTAATKTCVSPQVLVAGNCV